MVSFTSRAREPEILDRETPSQDILAQCYRFIRGVNRWFGGRRALLSRFEEFSKTWKAGERITVLDVGVGAADLPAALQRWAANRGYALRAVAVDIDPEVIRFARAEEPGILFCQNDIKRLGFRDGAFDYVTCSMLFHHLGDEEVVGALRSFDRIARRGIVINDLLRRLRAWLWIKLFTLPFNRVLRYDGPLSVRKGFKVSEIRRLASEAGLDYLTARVHFGHRFTLAGQKPPAVSS
ncbi:MAG: methyltransferase domain-containing protein [Gemmatimonadales bacterium]